MSKTVNSCEKSDDKSIVFEKSSFDRFGDDLIELILNYLPLNDKFRLECLSKQVQSLIYNKHRTLDLSPSKSINSLKEILTKPDKTGLNQNLWGINYSAFETVLKKCKNLDEIQICRSISCDQRSIRTIADNCQHLKNISINSKNIRDIPSDCLKYFAQKCGSTLHSLNSDTLSNEQMKNMSPFLLELRSINVENINSILNHYYTVHRHSTHSSTTDGMTKYLPKLQEIRFYRCHENSLKEFQNQYSDNIMKITANLMSYDMKWEAMVSVLTGFRRFHKMESLHLYITLYNDSQFRSIDKSLRQLIKDCPQLKQFRFNFYGNLLETNNLLSIFSTLKALTTLEIKITSRVVNFEDSPPYNYGSIRDLRHLSQLKHLSLTLDQLSVEYIDSIAEYLPQLVSIRFNTYKAITDKSLEKFLRLKCLKRLEIRCFTADVDHNITNEGVKQIIENCDRLRTLSFGQNNRDFEFDINEESIEAMVLKSKQMPEIQYNFSFSVNNFKKRNQLSNQLNDLPSNLSINLF